MTLRADLEKIIETDGSELHRLLDVALGKPDVRPFITGVLYSVADEPLPPAVTDLAAEVARDLAEPLEKAVTQLRTMLRAEELAA